jgi:hypothetical protein
MTMTATISNIDVGNSQTPDTNDNLLNAHIHAGPTVAPGINGPVVWGFFGAPFNDNNPNDAVATPAAGGVGGTFTGKWDAPEGQRHYAGRPIGEPACGPCLHQFSHRAITAVERFAATSRQRTHFVIRWSQASTLVQKRGPLCCGKSQSKKNSA